MQTQALPRASPQSPAREIRLFFENLWIRRDPQSFDPREASPATHPRLAACARAARLLHRAIAAVPSPVVFQQLGSARKRVRSVAGREVLLPGGYPAAGGTRAGQTRRWPCQRKGVPKRMRPCPTRERTWFAGRGCSATQAPRHPRNTQQRREAAAAEKTRPDCKSTMPVMTSKATATNERERKAIDNACRATAGCRPSTMPLAKAAAIATAGSFMALFATAQAFQYEKSAETDRTNAFP